MVLKTTRITIETETLMIIRQAKTSLAWCPDCREEVDVITVNDSLTVPAIAAQIQEWVVTGKP